MATPLAITNLNAINRLYNQTMIVSLDWTGAIFPDLTGAFFPNSSQTVISGDDLIALRHYLSPVTGTITSANANETAYNVSISQSDINSALINVNIHTSIPYSISSTNVGTVTVTISQAPIDITGITAHNKLSDRTRTAILNFDKVQVTGIITDDSIHLNGTGCFASENPGYKIQVYISKNNIQLSGAASVNYIINCISPHSTKANIIQQDIIIVLLKVYNSYILNINKNKCTQLAMKYYPDAFCSK